MIYVFNIARKKKVIFLCLFSFDKKLDRKDILWQLGI